MGRVILRGRIPGQKDLSIFDTRGNISPEIQALWGRYEDPTINYAKSVMKMSSLVANHQFLSDLRGLGLKEGWLYNGPEADRPRGYLKISSDNNKSLAPLAGLHGDKLLVEALYQMFPQNGVSDNYAWVRALSKVTGWSMAAKTTERLWKAFSPGASDTAGRIIKAGVGDVSNSGRAYNLANELFGLAAGQRITEVNVEQALGFKASKFNRDIKNPNQWPLGGWNFEEPSTGFRFRGSSLQDLAAKVKLHREVNYLGREDRVEEDIQEQIILKAPEEFDGWEEG